MHSVVRRLIADECTENPLRKQKLRCCSLAGYSTEYLADVMELVPHEKTSLLVRPGCSRTVVVTHLGVETGQRCSGVPSASECE